VTEWQASVVAAIEAQLAHINRELAERAATETPLGAR
jgi:hypothetical protein